MVGCYGQLGDEASQPINADINAFGGALFISWDSFTLFYGQDTPPKLGDFVSKFRLHHN